MKLAVAAGATAATIVGASVPITGMLEGYPVLTGQAMRYALGAAVLLLVARRLPMPSWRDIPPLLGIVASGMLGFNALLIAAQQYAEPGFVAAVMGSSPIVLALLARNRSLAAVVGAVVVAAGVVVLSGGGAWHGPGLVLALLTMVGEVCFTLFAVGVVKRMGVLGVATWTCLLAAAIGAVLGTFIEGWRMPDARQSFALVTLAVVVTALAFGLWYFAVNRLGSDRAGVLIGLMPVAGLTTSVLLGAQELSLVSTAGAVTVALGCVIGLRRGSTKAAADIPSSERPLATAAAT
ncbi:threonine/homoserine efflux transporter RhtA [Lentzea atacamensis]|uniref:Threonine/homoserine efflux transporter RhtA n=1 Tax=Lentzea atacamensis TaxID=531938 RepID=A0A316IFR7_9PSEU|nr:DMT family transporter [Lentzea atacamensis]PWK91560.1 threonine/homoserine efflux transporter RhtA [Lentzea atacamensis]